MKSLTFVLISIASGMLAGLVLAAVNLFVVEPYIDRAIEIETSNSIASGEIVDYSELNSYRTWQKSGTFAAGAILGMAYGAILGVVYVLSRKFLPFSGDRKKAIFLAAVICLSLYIVPFVMYPANPPAVGDPETIGQRESRYVGFQVASGLVTSGLGALMYKLRRVNHFTYLVPIFYVALIAYLYSIFPSNPDKIDIPMDLVNTFRIVTASTMVMFWIVLGAIFGMMWHRFRPHEEAKVKAI